jgi:SSS family solute:Na+ symporter
MSSADSCLLAGSSLFCNNVLKPLVPDIPEKKFLLITRLSTVVFAGVSLFFALNVRNIYLLMKNSWGTQLAIVFLPVMAALYLPRASKRAAWAGMVVSTVVWLGYCITFSLRSSDSFVDLMNNFDRPLTCGVVYGFAAGTIVFFACYFFEEMVKKSNNNKEVSQ